jgi:cytochrome c oxidase subunit 3
MAEPRFVDVNTRLLPDEPQPTLSMNPKKFMLYLFIASIIMIFAAFTSGYIVRRAEGNWLIFDLPAMFNISSLIIIVSSVSMQLAVFAALKNNIQLLKLMMSITFLLGISFCVTQFLGWAEMVEIGVYLTGNPSGSFVYVISLVHAVHLISGLVFIAIVFVKTFQLKVHSQNTNTIEMCAVFWHFLGILWLYLFTFLTLYR